MPIESIKADATAYAVAKAKNKGKKNPDYPQFLERQAAMAPLKKQSPAAWREIVDKFQEPLRTRLARIIWWDWFGRRKVFERWSELDDYVDGPYEEVPDEDLIVALWQCGYYPYDAVQRGSLPKS